MNIKTLTAAILAAGCAFGAVADEQKSVPTTAEAKNAQPVELEKTDDPEDQFVSAEFHIGIDSRYMTYGMIDGKDPIVVPGAQVKFLDWVYFGVESIFDVTKGDDWPVYAYCAKFGVDRAAVDRGWQRYRNLWDGGFISFAELYGRTFADAGATIGTAQLDVLWELDAADWFRTLRTDTLALMRRLKASGKKLGVLSNLSPESYERLFVPRCAEYRALLDAEVISGLELLYKPEEPIYRLMEGRMGLPPDRLLFLDDTEANVRAARAFGWHAEVYPPACS